MANSYNFPFANVTNSDLHILLNNNTVHRFPLPTVDNMVFNPFLLNDNNLRNSDNRSDEMSIPDFQEPRCNYHFINTMNSTYQTPTIVSIFSRTIYVAFHHKSMPFKISV